MDNSIQNWWKDKYSDEMMLTIVNFSNNVLGAHTQPGGTITSSILNQKEINVGHLTFDFSSKRVLKIFRNCDDVLVHVMPYDQVRNFRLSLKSKLFGIKTYELTITLWYEFEQYEDTIVVDEFVWSDCKMNNRIKKFLKNGLW